MEELRSSENEDLQLLGMCCPVCKSIPMETHVSSCMHLFCEDCLLSLAGSTEDTEGRTVCPVCDVPIEEVAPCGPVERIFLDPMPEAESPNQKGAAEGKNKKKEQQKKHARSQKKKAARNIFNSNNHDEEDDGDESNEADETKDWMAIAGHLMPSAKVTKVREIIREWLHEAPDTKVVIFTQFRVMATIFGSMCIQEDWGYTCLLGSMSFTSRDESIRDFQENENIRVMIASLKAGGIGLDLTMANKCILLEPWWNEAIQQQAFCRLSRIGQERNVEIIKLVVKDTIDDYMLELQQKKTQEIEGAIGVEALSNRDTIPHLLELFGEVSGNEKDGFIIIPDREHT
ncbi:hypothetical protein VTN96DRAFT_3063 [Rasamsonia emersonii]